MNNKAMPVDVENSYIIEMAAAEHAAREAGAVIMKLFKGKFDVKEKAKNNPVTTADLEANRKIREFITGHFPDDGWLSEEDDDSTRRLRTSRVWVIDPIDGTKEFIEGIPQFAVSIALVVDGRPKVAVVYNPAEERFYQAVSGQGALLNGSSIRVTSRNQMEGALLLVSRSEPRRKFQIFVERCNIEPIGSIAFRLAKVAGGDGDGTLTFRLIHEWDICAGVLMVEEAGGMVVDGGGHALKFNQQVPKHHGVVAAGASLTLQLQGLWAQAASLTR